MIMTIRRRSVLWTLLLLLISISVAPIAYARPSREQLDRALLSTVLVFGLDEGLDVIGSGSGSIVDPRGLILTNFHVIGDTDQGEFFNEDGVAAIAVTRNAKRAAVPSYFAQVVKANPELDLALLRIVADIEGEDLKGCQTLPAYSLGNSDDLNPGDELTIIGFPGIGGQSVTLTSGRVSGFDSDRSGEVTLIKTDAEINPGNSGGSAVNDDGALVGVPTFTIEGQGGRQGKIGLVRPINLGSALLKNLAGVGVGGCGKGSGGTTTPTRPTRPGESSAEFLGFATELQEDPEFVMTAASGITELYGYFSYSGIEEDTPLSLQWSYDGQLIEDTIYESDTWPIDPGTSTAYASLTSDEGLDPGTYTLEVQIGDLDPLVAEIEIGGRGGSGGTGGRGEITEIGITGQVLSADSGKAIPNALFVILAPGVDWASFEPNKSDDVYDSVTTDSKGFFQTSKLIGLDKTYSMGIVSKGYQPLLVDEFVARNAYEGGNFLDLGQITLKRK
jgi:serine protease Do